MRHGFFGREGGVSVGIYASLNAGPGSRDDAAAIAENRRRIAAAFDLAPDHLLGVHQIHSPTCVTVNAPWSAERPGADALVTKTPGLALSILTADCAPVLFADHEAGVIGAAHAGWKGAVGGVLEATVQAMIALGAEARRIEAAIGPCIHQQSYEVGPDFEARLLAADARNAAFFAPGAGEKLQFDLPGFCVTRLRAVGVTNVETLALDTYGATQTLFSHRRSVHAGEPDYGRNCAVIVLG
ncbi:MAG: peptidoglycan editing factor PgeF [Terricaulis sp.]